MDAFIKNILLSVKWQAMILASMLAFLLVWSLNAKGFTCQTILWDVIPLAILTLLSLLLLDVIQRYFNSKAAFNTSNSALILLLFTITISLNYWLGSSLHHSSDTGYIAFLEATFVYRALIVALLFLFSHMRFWSARKQLREAESKALAISQQRDMVQIEINSIQQQLKPHFLFNSLNSINALTKTNPEEAQKIVQLLSEFMRGSIQQHQSELVSLKEEIRHLQLYTDIEKVRFGDRLHVNYEIEESLLDMKLPFLILQPIIENAIKYGLYGNTDQVTIALLARMHENHLEIAVSNPFDVITQETNKGTGFGIRSIQRKLLLIYQRSNLLKTQTENSIFTATLQIPQL